MNDERRGRPQEMKLNSPKVVPTGRAASHERDEKGNASNITLVGLFQLSRLRAPGAALCQTWFLTVLSSALIRPSFYNRGPLEPRKLAVLKIPGQIT